MIIGIDGCKSGWILSLYFQSEYSFHHISKINEIEKFKISSSDLILIDIPIGIPSSKRKRNLETKLRKKYPNQSSSLFNVSTLESLKANSYQEASKINASITGKKLSLQSYYIGEKIVEVENYNTKKSGYKLLESHPELCLQELNSSNINFASKKSSIGREQRLKLIQRIDAKLYTTFLKEIKNKKLPFYKVAKDDYIDAMILNISAQFIAKNKTQIIADDEINNLNQKVKIQMHLPQIDDAFLKKFNNN